MRILDTLLVAALVGLAVGCFALALLLSVMDLRFGKDLNESLECGKYMTTLIISGSLMLGGVMAGRKRG